MWTLIALAASALATQGSSTDRAVAYEPEDWTDVLDRRPAPKPKAPVLGLADLHVHPWALSSAEGPPSVALHVDSAADSSWTDDVPSGGISDADTLPHWLGWPAASSTERQQAWEGWLRLSHDGVPALWYLSEHPEFDDVHDALTSFYARYQSNVTDAANAGAMGVNLVVMSLSHDEWTCRATTPRATLRDNPAVCNDMDAIKRQYDAVLYWAEQNRDWAEIVVNPAQAQAAVRDGRLAIVLSLEAANLFGPSETIGDGAPFREGYRGYARTLAGGNPPADEHIRDALHRYLDHFDRVTTVQLVTRYDTAFAGAAFRSEAQLRDQLEWDARGGRYRPNDGDAVVCKRAAEAWKFDNDAQAAYPECLARVSTRRGRVKQHSGPQIQPKQTRMPGVYRKLALQSGSTAARFENPYGLSTDGRLLVDVLLQRGMPIDVAHASRAAFADVLAAVDVTQPGHPVYVSHAYPDETNLLHREENLDAEQLEALAQRGGMVGVHTGADEAKANGQPGPFAEALLSHDCTGTTVSAGLHQQTVAEVGLPVAWGTNLNGGETQVGPTQQLRPPTWQQQPCAIAVPSIGSEVAQRGLAHVGLLPQLQMELLAMADTRTSNREDLPAAIDNALHGATSYIELWNKVWCTSEEADASYCRLSHRRTRIRPWANWSTWLMDEDDESETAPQLATIEVDLVAAGGTAPQDWGTNAAVMRSKRAGDVKSFGSDARSPTVTSGDDDADAQPGTVALQRWRALEAVLPYVADHGAEPEVALSWPQLPTDIGFLIGGHTYTAARLPASFPYARCVHSGELGGVRYDRKWECRPILDAMRRYRRARGWPALRHDLGRPLAGWNHTYPGQRAPNVHEITLTGALPPMSLYALGRRIVRRQGQDTLYAQLLAVHQADAPSAWRDFAAFEPVASFLTEQRVCLASGVLTAPPPGVPTGGDPQVWLEGASKLARACYCELLYQADVAPLLSEREEGAMQACTTEVFGRR